MQPLNIITTSLAIFFFLLSSLLGSLLYVANFKVKAVEDHQMGVAVGLIGDLADCATQTYGILDTLVKEKYDL